MPDEVIKMLRHAVKGEVSDDDETLAAYSTDASLFKIRPKAVVFPKDAEDVKNLVRAAVKRYAYGDAPFSLTARSAGTDMTGGPLSESVVVEFAKHFNRLRGIGNDYAVAEPGLLYCDFERETLARGLLLPSFPTSRDFCAVGGMVANNCGGEKTLAYGKTEDYVRRIKIVLRDGNEYVFEPLSMAELAKKKKADSLEGEIYRKMWALVEKNYDLLQKAKPQVTKNSAGYYLWNIFDKEKNIFDLTRLVVGSQGTLGIITEVTFKLIRPKRHSRLLVIYLENLDLLAKVTFDVLRFQPESFESYDGYALSMAMRLLFKKIKKLKGNVLSLGLSFLPDLWMVATGGVPKMILLAEFTDDDESKAYARALSAQKEIAHYGLKTKVTRSNQESEKYRIIKRESSNLLRYRIHEKRTAPFIDDIIVRPERMLEFLSKLYEILNRYNIIYTVAGHVGSGNFHIIPLLDFHNPKSRDIVKEISAGVYRIVCDFGGSITAEHNDGLVRSPYLKMMYGAKIMKIFEETKAIFDPLRIFNPGKKVGSSLKYALEHVNLEII